MSGTRLAARLALGIGLLSGLACGDSSGPSTAPAPQISSVAPNDFEAQDTAITLTVSGTDFVHRSTVRLDGTALHTTFVNGSTLRAKVPPALMATAGGHFVTVVTSEPGGGTTLAVSVFVEAAIAVISDVSPSDVMALSPAVELTIAGDRFKTGCVIYADTAALVTQRISATQLKATLPVELLRRSDTLMLRALNPNSNSSVEVPLVVRGPAPVVTGLGTSQIDAGLDSFDLHINGTGFLQNSVASFAGASRPTSWISATELVLHLPADDIGQTGVFPVEVTTPAPGGGHSAAVNLTLVNGVPALTGVPSRSVTAGVPGFTITVYGTGFVTTSTISWNGTAIPTSYISGSRLTGSVPAGLVATPGIGNVVVVNPAPGGGSSAPTAITVRAAPSATVTNQSTVALPANDLVYSPTAGRLYLTIKSSAPTRANTVTEVDPANGGIGTFVFVGSQPGRIAMADDGSRLWVALDGANGVRQVSLPALTPGLQFDLGAGMTVDEMEVLRGQPTSVVITRQFLQQSPRNTGTFVYDNGVARPNAGPGHTGSNSIALGAAPNVVYGFNNETSEFGVRRLVIDPAGIREVQNKTGLINSYFRHIRQAAGRIYGSGGEIIDADRLQSVGTLPHGGVSVLPDTALGRAYVLQENGAIEAFDLYTFQSLGSVQVSGSAIDFFNARVHLVKWGADGLAFVDGSQLFLIRTPLAAP